MKFLITLIILTVIGVLVYQRTAGITLSLLNDCYSQAKAEFRLNDEAVRAVCSNNKNALRQMSACLEAVQKQKFVAGILYELSGVKDKVIILTTSHNQLCPEQRVPIPTAELYL